MTLSILAFDPKDDVVGAAVTSCVLAAGRRVLHLRPGVGAVAAQASSNITWGTDILDALQAGATLADAIAPFSREDVQLAVIDFTGRVAGHNGAECPSHAAQIFRHGVAAQVNLAALPDAVERMLAAFDAAVDQPLAERLVAALAASGDDSRGKQSAAVYVSGRGPLNGETNEPHVDLRVDDHREPVAELSRLLSLHRAHLAMRETFSGEVGDAEAVLTPLAEAHPDDPHLRTALARAQSER